MARRKGGPGKPLFMPQKYLNAPIVGNPNGVPGMPPGGIIGSIFSPGQIQAMVAATGELEGPPPAPVREVVTVGSCTVRIFDFDCGLRAPKQDTSEQCALVHVRDGVLLQDVIFPGGDVVKDKFEFVYQSSVKGDASKAVGQVLISRFTRGRPNVVKRIRVPAVGRHAVAWDLTTDRPLRDPFRPNVKNPRNIAPPGRYRATVKVSIPDGEPCWAEYDFLVLDLDYEITDRYQRVIDRLKKQPVGDANKPLGDLNPWVRVWTIIQQGGNDLARKYRDRLIGRDGTIGNACWSICLSAFLARRAEAAFVTGKPTACWKKLIADADASIREEEDRLRGSDKLAASSAFNGLVQRILRRTLKCHDVDDISAAIVSTCGDSECAESDLKAISEILADSTKTALLNLPGEIPTAIFRRFSQNVLLINLMEAYKKAKAELEQR